MKLLLFTIIALTFVSCSIINRNGYYSIKSQSEGITSFKRVLGKYRIPVTLKKRIYVRLTKDSAKANVFLITKL